MAMRRFMLIPLCPRRSNDQSIEPGLAALRSLSGASGKLLEGRRLQPFQVALAGRSAREQMFGDLKRRRSLAAIETGVEKDIVQGAAEDRQCGMIVAHAALFIRSHQTRK